VKETGIKKGDQINLEEQGNDILIQSTSKKEPKKAELNLTTSYFNYIFNLIRNLYLNAYDVIHLNLHSEEDILTVNHVVDMLIGYEIIEKKKLRCTIKDITNESEEDFDTIYRQVWRTVRSMIDIVIDSLSNGHNKTNHLKIKDIIVNISRLSSYCRRVIYKNKLTKDDKGLSDYMIINRLFMIGRNLFWVHEFIYKNKFKIKKETVDFSKQFLDSYDSLYDLYYSKDTIYGKKTKDSTEDLIRLAYSLLEKDATKNSVVIFRLIEAVRFIAASIPKVEIAKLFNQDINKINPFL